MKKKPGPKPTGVGKQVMVRCKDDLLRQVDDWRRLEEDIPSRSEAIRRLVEQALTAPKKR